MAAAGVAALSYAAAGDKKQALIMAAGIALAAVGAGGAVVAYKSVKSFQTAKKIVTVASTGVKDLGSAGKVTSWMAGHMWTGKAFGSVRTSASGLSRYRAPTLKQTGPLAGRVASNFERRATTAISKRKAWNFPNKYTNGHLTIKGWW